ncbi:MAG TPA: Hpt domain-containing protein [Ktedonobacteraceae bacterium]|nr:Hpt domain-containing protein [Ktedonobacteraceae bacterium]
MAKERWETALPESSPSPGASSAQQETSSSVLDDVRAIFFSEVEEDLVVMREALRRLERGNDIDSARLTALRRVAHKLQGSAGMMSYPALAAIASSIERIVEAIATSKIGPLLGVSALVQAVFALETTFDDLVNKGVENDRPHRELEIYLRQLALGLQKPSFMHVDSQRLAQLMQLTEQLGLLRTSVEQAQMQMERALQELDAAQTRWQSLETELLTLVSRPRSFGFPYDIYPTSFRLAQLLQDAAQQNEVFHPRKLRFRIRLIKPDTEPSQEKPETDDDKLIRTLLEAYANLTTASSHVHTTFVHFSSTLNEYMAHVDTVRDEVHLLPPSPANSK